MKIQSISTVWVVACLLAGSQTVAAQATIDTVGLRGRPLELKTEPLAEDGVSGIITSETYRTIGKGGPVTICEVMPAYIKRNKKDNLLLFIQQNIRWPSMGLRMQVEGKVLISFIVDTDGNAYRFKVIKGLHPAFDAEALRVAQLLNGCFSPALCGGIARAHEVVVPVYFALK
ncbi:TonB family protein [Hymenobacter sp. UYP22]|uniref:energy transducer TonB n=1 Tax=Hymenobacter sp. UYP22 TaxID=3156348 RepID=UPI003398F01E